MKDRSKFGFKLDTKNSYLQTNSCCEQLHPEMAAKEAVSGDEPPSSILFGQRHVCCFSMYIHTPTIVHLHVSIHLVSTFMFLFYVKICVLL